MYCRLEIVSITINNHNPSSSIIFIIIIIIIIIIFFLVRLHQLQAKEHKFEHQHTDSHGVLKMKSINEIITSSIELHSKKNPI
ncbi:hypothetical protein ACLKA6_008837 [Drosophila palustris]